MSLEELKERSQLIRAQYEGKYHVKWPADFKREVVALLKSGESLASLKKATGIAHQTMALWGLGSREPKKTSKFQEVAVSYKDETDIVLKWSESLEVRGLSFAQFTELLERGLL